MTQQPNLQSLPSPQPSPLAVPWSPAPQQQVQPPAQMSSEQAPYPQTMAQAMPQMTVPHVVPQTAYQPLAHAPVQPDFAPTPQQLQSSQTPPAFQMPPGRAQTFQTPQAHPGLPPMPHQHLATHQRAEAVIKSPAPTSRLSRLKPKPKATSEESASVRSGSLFDLKFLIGLAAGTVLGFVVLPMVFGGADTPTATPVAQAPVADVQPALVTEGESFVDAALAETP